MSNLSIVNFAAEDTGTATLMRAVPKVDASTKGTHQWDIDLVASVDEDGALHVAPVLPQAGEYLARARDGKGSAQITIKPTTRDLRLTLHTSDGEIVLEDVSAEIRLMRLHLTEKNQSYVARLRLHGLEPEDSARLVAALGDPLQITAVPIQTEFEYDGPVLGSIVNADRQGGIGDVYGVLAKRTGNGMIIDNFGVIYTVDKINAAIQLTDGHEGFVDDYAASARAAGGNPSWADLLASMAEVGDGSTIDAEVVTHALARQLPAEAGARG